MVLFRRLAMYAAVVGAAFAAIAAGAFYFERQAEFGRINEAKPTYTHFDPVTKKYTDYAPPAIKE